MNRTARVCTTVWILSLFFTPFAWGTPEAGPILPTWKLMTGDQKRQYIAGYQQGLRESAQITGVALEYIEKNPNDAVSTLKRVRSLYNQAPDTDPNDLVVKLNKYLAAPENSSSTLSSAVNAIVTAPSNPYSER